jgi:hypothetical protein
VDHAGSDTTKKIEDKISNVANPILNVIPEDIKEPHVPEDVKDSSMKKHGGQKGEKLLECREMDRNLRVGVSDRNNTKKE